MFFNLVKSGWLHAFFIAVVTYPLGAIAAKLIAGNISINPLVFSVTCSLATSFILLLKAGPGPLAIKTLKAWQTWIFSLCGFFVMIFGILIMQYVSATEGAGLYRLTGFIIFFLSFFILTEKISKFEIASSLIILIGVSVIIVSLDIGNLEKLVLLLFTFIRAISQGLKKIIVQVHKTNKLANTPKDQSRVTALVIMVNSFILLAILVVSAFFKSQGYDLFILKSMPSFYDFTNFTGYLFAIVLGGIVLSVNSYCDFYANKTIGARYLSTLLALQIVFVYLIEYILSKFNIMEVVDISLYTGIGLFLIILGNVLISSYGFIKVLKK